MAVLALVAGGAAAPAYTRREVACQAAIARAGRAFVAAEMANQARCRARAIVGRECDPESRTTANEAKLRRVIARCAKVKLARMNVGSCAARAADGGATALADCLISGHEQAVETLVDDEFGFGDQAIRPLPAPAR